MKGLELNLGWAHGEHLQLQLGVVVQESERDEAEPDFGVTEFFRTPDVYGVASVAWEIPSLVDVWLGARDAGYVYGPRYPRSYYLTLGLAFWNPSWRVASGTSRDAGSRLTGGAAPRSYARSLRSKAAEAVTGRLSRLGARELVDASAPVVPATAGLGDELRLVRKSREGSGLPLPPLESSTGRTGCGGTGRGQVVGPWPRREGPWRRWHRPWLPQPCPRAWGRSRGHEATSSEELRADGSGSALYAGGAISGVGGLASVGVATWRCTPDTTPPSDPGALGSSRHSVSAWSHGRAVAPGPPGGSRGRTAAAIMPGARPARASRVVFSGRGKGGGARRPRPTEWA